MINSFFPGFLKCPKLLVVILGSDPVYNTSFGIVLNASMTTLPLTDWMGSTTTAIDRAFNFSMVLAVLTSTSDSQQPNPGCECYQPTMFSGLPTCLSASSMSIWNFSSMVSTETVVPLCGNAKTS